MRIHDGITTLRRLHPDDQPVFLAYRNDPDVARYQSWPQMTAAETAGFLHHCATIDPLLRPDHWTQIAVANTATDALIGDMGLHLSADGSEAEIGITLQAASQRMGHATRAMRLGVDHLFQTTDITRIIAGADARNTPSLALIRRLGFVQTGVTTVEGVTEIDFEVVR